MSRRIRAGRVHGGQLSHATMLSRATAEMRSGSGGRRVWAVAAVGERRGEECEERREVRPGAREGGWRGEQRRGERRRRAGPTVWAAGRRGLSGGRRRRAFCEDTTARCAGEWWRARQPTTHARRARGEETGAERAAAAAAATATAGWQQQQIQAAALRVGRPRRWHRTGQIL